MARQMAMRCVAEGVRRGFLTEDEDAVRAQYLECAEQMAADESGDLLIGTQSVANADEDRIRWVAQAAFRRVRVLGGVIDYLGGRADSELHIRAAG
jgi:hypothetical protein